MTKSVAGQTATLFFLVDIKSVSTVRRPPCTAVPIKREAPVRPDGVAPDTFPLTVFALSNERFCQKKRLAA